METVRTHRPPSCCFTLPCELRSAREACRRVRDFLAESGLPASEQEAWELALAEAVNNAVLYATPAGRSQPVLIDMTVGEASVEARVTDHTPGFDWPEQAELPDAETESGRGVFLMQQLTDESAYLRSRRENCLILRRARAGAPPPPPPSSIPGLQKDLAEARHTLDLMTEELASSYESLSTMFRFSAELHTDGVSDEFVRRWLDHLISITEADWYILRLAGRDGQDLQTAAASLPGRRGEALSLRSTQGSVEIRSATKRVDVWFDPQAPLQAGDPLAEFGPDSCGFAHPLFVNDSLVGVLAVGRRSGNRQFEAGQLSVIQTFADFLGIQIRNRQFHQEQVQSRLLTRELEIASTIQRSLLPEQLPALPHISLAGFYRSARQVGGDYYDALPTGDGSVLLVVADVMGKGLPAALFALMFRSLVRSRSDLAPRPGEFMAWLNRNLFRELDRADMFITAQLVFVDHDRGGILVASAGHHPLLAAREGEVQEVSASGAPLGVLENERYQEAHYTCRHGGRALMFTDGLVEAHNQAGERLGYGPVKSALLAGTQAGESSADLQRRLVSLLLDFEQDKLPFDDTAFIIIADKT